MGTLLNKDAMIVCICNPSTLKRRVRVRQENHREAEGQLSGVQWSQERPCSPREESSDSPKLSSCLQMQGMVHVYLFFLSLLFPCLFPLSISLSSLHLSLFLSHTHITWTHKHKHQLTKNEWPKERRHSWVMNNISRGQHGNPYNQSHHDIY